MRFRLLWTIIKLFITSKAFRTFMAEKLAEWARSKPALRGKSSPNVQATPEPREASRRRAQTQVFAFTTPEDGEKRSGKTGTFVAPEGAVEAELAKRGYNPDGTPKRLE